MEVNYFILFNLRQPFLFYVFPNICLFFYGIPRQRLLWPIQVPLLSTNFAVFLITTNIMQSHLFIHSGHFYTLPVHYYSEALPTIQHGYCGEVPRRSAQATAGKGLAQGPYVVARAGVEPTTLRLRVIDLTNAPPRLSCS